MSHLSAQTWYIIAIIGFSLSAVALIAAVFIFLKLDIISVIGDLTGRTVAREVQAIRENNASGGEKLHRSSRVNLERGKLTSKVSSALRKSKTFAPFSSISKRLDSKHGDVSDSQENSITSGNNPQKATVLSDKALELTETISKNAAEINTSGFKKNENPSNNMIIPNSGTPLPGTTVLGVGNDAKEISANENMGTTVLNGVTAQLEEVVQPVAFRIVKSMTEIHTDERIY